ncbi:hypothetical protein AB6A40_005394 [Gnathostoma spinigerum]|uniref:Uncharacterized protein n=1 Tax=Gnathostoma spinigerum TaxID=75299 RepID=A0ABD6EGF9_9BILA
MHCSVTELGFLDDCRRLNHQISSFRSTGVYDQEVVTAIQHQFNGLSKLYRSVVECCLRQDRKTYRTAFSLLKKEWENVLSETKKFPQFSSSLNDSGIGTSYSFQERPTFNTNHASCKSLKKHVDVESFSSISQTRITKITLPIKRSPIQSNFRTRFLADPQYSAKPMNPTLTQLHLASAFLILIMTVTLSLLFSCTTIRTTVTYDVEPLV